MSERDREHWDQKWDDYGPVADVNPMLLEHRRLLGRGVALDVACGLGQNAIWLARHDFVVLGVDISRVALRRAHLMVRAAGLARRACFAQVDLDHWSPAPATVDVICVFRFLDRSLIPALRDALNPGGLIFYATRHVGVLRRQPEANPDFLLKRGELPGLFAGWELLVSAEGAEDASIIARKPRQGC